MSAYAAGSVPALGLQQTELERLSHQRRLRFPEPLEGQFRADYFERWRATNRAAFVGGGLVYALFGIVDVWAAPRSWEAILLLRFGAGGPLIVLLLALSFTELYRRLMQPAGAFVVASVGFLIASMEVLANPGEPVHDLYVFGVAIVVMFGYAAPRLRFWYATAAGWTSVLASWWVGFHHAIWSDLEATLHFVVIETLILGANLIGMLAAYFMESSARQSFVQQRMIEEERARSEALLLNVLPSPVTERLKRGEDVVEAFSDVTVLFADIVDFTALSATTDAHGVVAFLNRSFSTFDELTERHGLEKIKTMGDAYMVVGGLPVPVEDHVERVAELALDMNEEAARLGWELGRDIQLRIGVHTGPVVAGIIGLRKFSYDLWGDTVNTASRMESLGEPGRIQVTEAVYRRLGDRYVFEGPNALLVKGKGELTTYFLTGRDGGRLGS